MFNIPDWAIIDVHGKVASSYLEMLHGNHSTFECHIPSKRRSGYYIWKVIFPLMREGTLQELKTRASHSILGIEVFHHTLHTHEFWEADEMKRLWGNVNEDGKVYEMDLTREPNEYVGTLNNQMIKLPADAFPIAVWHYAITEHVQLFSIPEFRLFVVPYPISRVDLL